MSFNPVIDLVIFSPKLEVKLEDIAGVIFLAKVSEIVEPLRPDIKSLVKPNTSSLIGLVINSFRIAFVTSDNMLIINCLNPCLKLLSVRVPLAIASTREFIPFSRLEPIDSANLTATIMKELPARSASLLRISRDC